MASWYFGLTLIFGLIGVGMSQDLLQMYQCPNGTTVKGELPMPLTYIHFIGNAPYTIEQCKLVDISGDGLADFVCETRRDTYIARKPAGYEGMYKMRPMTITKTCSCSYLGRPWLKEGNSSGGFALIYRPTNDGGGCYQWPTPAQVSSTTAYFNRYPHLRNYSDTQMYPGFGENSDTQQVYSKDIYKDVGYPIN